MSENLHAHRRKSLKSSAAKQLFSERIGGSILNNICCIAHALGVSRNYALRLDTTLWYIACFLKSHKLVTDTGLNGLKR